MCAWVKLDPSRNHSIADHVLLDAMTKPATPKVKTSPSKNRRTLIGAGLAGGLLTGMLAEAKPKTASGHMDEIEARWEILQCIYRCARGTDRHDPELAMTAFHDDAMDDHGYFVGLAKDFLQSSLTNHELYSARQHFIANHLAEIDGDTAHTETYYAAAMLRKESGNLELYFGRYIDRFERRQGRWAIAARAVISESALDPAVTKAFATFMLQGTQDKTDLSYQRPLQVTRPPRNGRPGDRTK